MSHLKIYKLVHWKVKIILRGLTLYSYSVLSNISEIPNLKKQKASFESKLEWV